MVFVGYIADSDIPLRARLPLALYDYIIVGFGLPQMTGELITTDFVKENINRLTADCHAHGKKILLSIGGGGVRLEYLIALLSDHKVIQKFCRSIVEFAQRHSIDGFDIDIEGIAPNLKKEFTHFCTALADHARKALGEQTIMTMALDPLSLLHTYDLTMVNELMTYAIHMSYGYYNPAAGPFRTNKTLGVWGEDDFFNATLIEASAYGSIKYLIDKGLEPKKILGGINFFASNNQPWRHFVEDKENLEPMHPDFLEKHDASKDIWITDAECIRAKTIAFLNAGLAGVAAWQISYDDTDFSLSHTTRTTLNNFYKKR